MVRNRLEREKKLAAARQLIFFVATQVATRRNARALQEQERELLSDQWREPLGIECASIREAV